MSQESFANRYGFSVENVRNWEQGIRHLEGSARFSDRDRARAIGGRKGVEHDRLN